MAIPTLLIAPASAGKTEYILNAAREASHRLERTPRILVPTRLQASAIRGRLAKLGGAIGVHVGTFDDLYADILNRSGELVTRFGEPIQKRILRTIVDHTPLHFYGSIQRMPGFIDILMDLIRELKAGGIHPAAFLSGIETLKKGHRLRELGKLYQTYQARLDQEDWTDYLGAGWLALDVLEREEASYPDWSPFIVDGFDDFSPIQMQVLEEMTSRVPEMIITLTGETDGADRSVVHKKFKRTRQRLKEALEPEVEYLPHKLSTAVLDPAIRHLERGLFKEQKEKIQSAGSVRMIAAPDREGEVRNALRWLKMKIKDGNFTAQETAVLFRNYEPYRPYLYSTAEEMGLPLYVEEGRPLGENPAIDALFTLLQVADKEGNYLDWRGTIEVWRSPYFDFETAYEGEGADVPIGIERQDAETLSWVARWGSVIQGEEQWQGAFSRLIALSGKHERKDEDLPEPPTELPQGDDARALWGKFQRFVSRIDPPHGKRPYRDFIAWVETLIGEQEPDGKESTTLNLAGRATQGPDRIVVRDLEALQQLKNVFRGLIWAEKMVETPPVSFHQFLQDLQDAVDRETYQPHQWEQGEAILATDVVEARGLSFQAVAILGMGEGEFPQTLHEDPFLRDEDRRGLRERLQIPLSPSTLSWEGEYFYEAVSRARQHLLLTRSRIADNGAPWQPSPYWEETRRCVNVQPVKLISQSHPPLEQSSSKPELVDAVCAQVDQGEVWERFQHWDPGIAASLGLREKLLQQRDRESVAQAGPFDGALSAYQGLFSGLFGSDHVWSASRLESYRVCPYFFFTNHVLGLEPRDPPQEGLDARQLGNIYHLIFEKLYRANRADPTLDQLLSALPEVAEPILDQAPAREGFRETAWWQETRQEIKENVVRSLRALERLREGYKFSFAEKTFGMEGREGPPLIVEGTQGDRFRLRGFIDRVDREPSGGIRIIDYKTSAPYAFTDQAVREGKKLQLPLYAMAAERALQLGEVKDGFYFHVRHAEPSKFQLKSFSHQDQHGPHAALKASVEGAWQAIRGARAGAFAPQVPDDGCPGYCPAAQYCWHYTPRSW